MLAGCLPSSACLCERVERNGRFCGQDDGAAACLTISVALFYK